MSEKKDDATHGLRLEERLALLPQLLLLSQLCAPDVADLCLTISNKVLGVEVLVLSRTERLLPQERISNGEDGNRCDHVGQTSVLLTRHEHLGEPRGDGEGRHSPTELGNLASDDTLLARSRLDGRGRLQGAEQGEDLLRLGQTGPIRGSWEWEVDDGVDVHALHLEDDPLYRHPQDLRLGVLLKVVLENGRRVEPVAVTGTGSTCTTRSLRGGSLADPRDSEGLDSRDGVEVALKRIGVKFWSASHKRQQIEEKRRERTSFARPVSTT